MGKTLPLHLRRRYPDVDRIFVSYFFLFLLFLRFFLYLKKSKFTRSKGKPSFIVHLASKSVKIDIRCAESDVIETGRDGMNAATVTANANIRIRIANTCTRTAKKIGIET